MTDRHIHCVFCDNIKHDIYRCIKHDKTFTTLPTPDNEGWFQAHCDDYIPKPCLLLSYYIFESENLPLEKREDCYKQANYFLEKHGWIK